MKKSGGSSGDNFNVTQSEMKRIEECMKDPEFVKLFQQYAEEIEDPKNRQEYYDYIRQLEMEQLEGGGSKTHEFIIPEPAFCIKTISNKDSKKVFINVCSSDKVAPPVEESGGRVRLPLSLGPMRDEFDNKGNPALVADIVYHPMCISRAEANPQYKKLLMDTALDYIESKYGEKLKRNVKILKRKKSKGEPKVQTIRVNKSEISDQSKSTAAARAEPALGDIPASQEDIVRLFERTFLGQEHVGKTMSDQLKLPQQQKQSKSAAGGGKNLIEEIVPEGDGGAKAVKKPKYTIVHRGEVDYSDYLCTREDLKRRGIPKELSVRIELPGVSLVSDVELDISKKQVLLKSQKHNYHLDITLPFEVDEDRGKAQFNKVTSLLTITLPVVPPPPPAEVVEAIKASKAAAQVPPPSTEEEKEEQEGDSKQKKEDGDLQAAGTPNTTETTPPVTNNTNNEEGEGEEVEKSGRRRQQQQQLTEESHVESDVTPTKQQEHCQENEAQHQQQPPAEVPHKKVTFNEEVNTVHHHNLSTTTTTTPAKITPQSPGKTDHPRPQAESAPEPSTPTTTTTNNTVTMEPDALVQTTTTTTTTTTAAVTATTATTSAPTKNTQPPQQAKQEKPQLPPQFYDIEFKNRYLFELD